MRRARKTRTLLRTGTAIAALALLAPTGAQAITNGVPDGSGHPNVGLLADKGDDGSALHNGRCSGWYAGPREGDPGTGVFVTAAHCVEGVPQGTLTVTFDEEITFDEQTEETIATTWYTSSAHVSSDVADIAVVLLTSPVAVDPVDLPPARLLSQLAARGALRPTTLFDTVGYGIVPTFKGGQIQYALPEGRNVAVSRFMGLTKSTLMLLGNPDAGYGGACFGDSGGPIFRHGTNTVVALTAGGGDAVCRASAGPTRLDVGGSRAFLGEYVPLP